MFDEDCYHRGLSALDEDFKSGRYYVVSDPNTTGPNNRIIHLPQDNRNFYKKRGGSSDNLLMVDDPYSSMPNGFNTRNGGRERRMEPNDWSDRRQNNDHKIKSMNNLYATNFNSPRSDNLNRDNRDRRNYESSYEYYRRYGDPLSLDHHPRHRYAKDMSRYDSISSDERSAYNQPYQTSDLYRSFSNDTESSDDVINNRGMGSRPVHRVANDEYLARSWDSKTPGGQRWQRMESYGSHGRLGSNDIQEKPSRNSQYSNNNSNTYRDGNVRQIQVDRTESRDLSNLSTKDYWENKWSSGSSDGRRRFVKSASPSLSGEINSRVSMAGERIRIPHLSTDNLSVSSDRRSHANNAERSRMNSRVIHEGVQNNSQKPPRPLPNSSTKSESDRISRIQESSNEKEFLSKVQQELEFQRRNLTGEIDKLLAPMGSEMGKAWSPVGSPGVNTGLLSPTFNAEKNSFVDTSGLCPVFKTFVDVNEYSPDSVTVGLDRLGNKVIVEARQDENPKSHIATSFTQKIPLPRYADTTSMSAKLNSKGVLKIEVPLLFYFPSDHENKSSANSLGKSFVYEVKTDSRDGSKVMEIIVKPGTDVTLNDVRVEVTENRQLTVFVERQTSGSTSGKERKVIKTYSLPDTAILNGITSRMAPDGTLAVSVPISGTRGLKR